MLPLLKKPGLESSSLANCRPTSNLFTVSKVFQRLLLTHLHPHLLSSANFSWFQSAYRKGHSTEPALLKVLDSVYTAASDKYVTVLINLDLSAVFDAVNRGILLNGCSPNLVLRETPPPWLQLYLEGQTHFFPFGSASVTSVKLEVGIPQGSVLGPLFVICCSLVEMSSQTMVFPTISKPITCSSTSP